MAIGTTMAILGAAAIGGGASLLAGSKGAQASTEAANIQASSAEKAAQAQLEAARISADIQREGLDFQKTTYEQSRADAMPWLDAGKKALSQYQVELGLEPGESTFQKTPGYDFMVEEGEKGIINNLSALGMKNSGAALKALTRFREGIANQTYDNYLNRLSGVAGTGQTASSTLGSLGQSAVSGVQNALGGIARTQENAGAARASGYLNAGQARASGVVGSANSWINAINNGVGTATNALGYLSYGNRGGFPAAPALGGVY